MRRKEEKLNRAGVLINEFPWQSLNYAAIAVITKSRSSRATGSRHPLEGPVLRGAGGGEYRGWGCAWAGVGRRARDKGVSIPRSGDTGITES